MTRSINVELELNEMGKGVNAWAPMTVPIVIRSLQISCSIAPSSPTYGSNQALFILQAYDIAPVTQGEGPDYMSGGIFTPSDWGPVTIDNPSGVPLAGGGFAGGGRLMSTILKTVAGAVNQIITRDGLNVSLPAGGYLLAHIDHAGFCDCDIEMQGVVDYD
jgi:hypothetical protein